MSYTIKEIFHSLHGEGANVGTPAVFCRFAGCNFWSGREVDRSSAICQFCDTEFVGSDGTFGGKYESAMSLAARIERMWSPGDHVHRFVVLTGGEPLLQLDQALIMALKKHQFRIAVETNGSIEVPPNVDWICVSPKRISAWVQKSGDELKIVWPQAGFDLEQLEQLPFKHFFLQPMDGPDINRNTACCIQTCLSRPAWRLSLQTHKITGLR